ncbi:MAG: nucleotide exchange factor GrpE [Thermoplasmata archaeon]|nr:nucleotide exchange factor GrpE [Thermoplasmata archaeon]
MSEEVPAPTSSPSDPAPPLPETAAPEEDWANRYKYLLAEFDNYRKRGERERESVRRIAEGRVLKAILPLYESFVNARVAAEKLLPSTDPMRKGLRLLAAEWNAFLDAQGIDLVVRPGMMFRPEEQEAVGDAPVSPDHPEGTVVEVVQQGYRFAGGLLRPAKVIVARSPRPTEASAAAAAPSESAPSSSD